MAENTAYDYESCRLIYEIRDAVESLKKRNAMLIAAQSKVDMEKCDIEHYIENGTFNASKGVRGRHDVKGVHGTAARHQE